MGTQPGSKLTYQSIPDWIAHDALPFPVEPSAHFDSAVDKVVASLGDAVELLTASPGPTRFIATRNGQCLPAESITAMPTRSGSKRNPTYFPLNPQSFTDFDWLAVLDSTAYNRGGQPLQG